MDLKKMISDGVAEAFASLGLTPGKPTPTQEAAPHPALSAALAAGYDTPEKFAQLAVDLKAGQDAAEELKQLKAQGPPAEHPVLTAALAAGVDTSEKFSTQATEAKAGREALTAAREEANLAAIAYFGKNIEGLTAAKALIEGETNLSQLNATIEKYWAGSPGADRPNKRLSQPAAPPAGGTPAPAPSDNFDHYAQFNAGAGTATK